jgi:hypothetical protein
MLVQMWMPFAHCRATSDSARLAQVFAALRVVIASFANRKCGTSAAR